MTDFAIPLVWPQYPITKGEQQFVGVGHAGVIIVNGSTGHTRYFEYGRYAEVSPGVHIGQVRSQPVANLSIVDGQIDGASLKNMLQGISRTAGKNTLVQGTILELDAGGYQDALNFANSAMNDEVGVLGEYSLNDNHCYTFAKQVAEAGGSAVDWYDGLWVFDNVPSTAIVRLIANNGGFALGGPEGTDFLAGGAANHVEGNPIGGDLCFAAGTPIAMADGSQKPIERVRVGDEVLAYDTDDASGAGALTARRVTHTFITPDRMILDFHGLQVTPGHVFLCGEGAWAGKHRMLIDILREDGSIVGVDGVSRRAATNCPVDSEGDRFVELAYITRAGESKHKTARIRAGTLLIDEAGEARSVLQCLEAEGYRLLEDGLVQKPGEAPGPLKFFGTPPKPEDYVLQRSGLTLAEIAGNTGYEPRPANPWGSALASGWTPDDNRSGEAERELFLAGTPTRNTAGETLH